MGFFRSKYFVVALVVLILGTAFAVYKIKSKPEVIFPDNILESMKDPKQTVIGKSVEGRKIESYTFGKGEKHLVFVGGIHGGYEWNSVLLAYKFIDYLTENPEMVPESLKITIIPSMNPDGLFKVVKKEGRFTLADIPTNKELLASGRFNANSVDLNRNFNCNWKPESKWQSKTVSAGTFPFSEPEAVAIRDFVTKENPNAFVFWHSQANTVYASQCDKGVLPETLDIVNLYSKATGYLSETTFESYEITGDVADWLSTINIPAITVELKTHETVEWEKNLLGINALFNYYTNK